MAHQDRHRQSSPVEKIATLAGWIFTHFFGNNNFTILHFAVAAVTLIAVVGAIGSYLEKYMTTRVSQLVSHGLRQVLEPIFMKYGVNVVFSGHEHVHERIHPQHGIYYFTEGSSGQLRSKNLKHTAITERGFDSDRTFMLVEIAGDDFYFQTISRTGQTVNSGSFRRQSSSEIAIARTPPSPALIPPDGLNQKAAELCS